VVVFFIYRPEALVADGALVSNATGMVEGGTCCNPMLPATISAAKYLGATAALEFLVLAVYVRIMPRQTGGCLAFENAFESIAMHLVAHILEVLKVYKFHVVVEFTLQISGMVTPRVSASKFQFLFLFYFHAFYQTHQLSFPLAHHSV
jgi:hypothetical protein